MISEHLAWLEQNDYSKVTLSSAQYWLENFQAFAGDRDLAELKTKDLERWYKELVWTPGPSGKIYSPNTVSQAVGAVRRLYRQLLEEGKVKADPARTLKTPQAKPTLEKKLDLSFSDQRKLLSSPDLESPLGIRDRAILGLLLETRVSCPACSRLDCSHLCLDTGALLTRGRTRQIHSLSDGLLADLHRYLRESRPLFVRAHTKALFLDRKGNRISGASVQQVVNRHFHLCGI